MWVWVWLRGQSIQHWSVLSDGLEQVTFGLFKLAGDNCLEGMHWSEPSQQLLSFIFFLLRLVETTCLDLLIGDLSHMGLWWAYRDNWENSLVSSILYVVGLAEFGKGCVLCIACLLDLSCLSPSWDWVWPWIYVWNNELTYWKRVLTCTLNICVRLFLRYLASKIDLLWNSFFAYTRLFVLVEFDQCVLLQASTTFS